MDKQLEILTWWYEEHQNEKMKLQEARESFKSETGNEKEDSTINNHIGKLEDRELLDKPEYATYKLSDRGINKAKSIIEGESISDRRPESFKDKKQELEEVIDKKWGEFAKKNMLEISLKKIDRESYDLIDWFEEEPEEFIEALEESIDLISPTDDPMPYRLNNDLDYFLREIYEAKDEDLVDKLVAVEGTIESTSRTELEIESALFECDECGERYEKEQESSKLKSPYKCECGSKKLNPIDKNHENVIEFKINDNKGNNEKIKGVFKSDGISDRANKAFKPGSNIRVTGILKGKPKNNKSSKIRPYLEILAYSRVNVTFDPDEIDSELRSKIKGKVETLDNPLEAFAQSLAPEIVGQEKAKKVFAVSLIGGSPKTNNAGEVLEDGRIHSLVLSNPGMGKSAIQEFIKETFSKTQYADGKNATGVALTATVEQNDGEYTLKAGKLVFANKGVLCLDEFDKMKNEDAEKLNTAMTSKTFPVDKGGINAELPGEATIIATGNFENYVDKGERAYPEIPDVHESVLDRFSLKYAMKGSNDEEEITESILDGFDDEGSPGKEPEFSKEELVAYRQLAKDIEPSLTSEARKALKAFFSGQRKIADSKGRPQSKTDSTRDLNHIVKLSTCIARSEFEDSVNDDHVERAFEIMQMCESSLEKNFEADSDIEEVSA
jgi:DNA replicative helicase MCM subunit Mcm2 (Cdc46/Mcm family)